MEVMDAAKSTKKDAEAGTESGLAGNQEVDQDPPFPPGFGPVLTFARQQGRAPTPTPMAVIEKNREVDEAGSVLGKRGTTEKDLDADEDLVNSEIGEERNKKMRGKDNVEGGENKGIDGGTEATGPGAAGKLTGAMASTRQEP